MSASCIRNASRVIDEAIKAYSPVKVFALFSGGHDSLCATHIASLHPSFSGAVHIHTGIGIPQTREFVHKTCKDMGWPLLEYTAQECGQDYEEMVLEYGFPGPPMHTKMYNRLKERPLRKLIREHKTKRMDKIILISGCRSQESVRRMGHVQPIQKDGAKIWTAVIHDWTKHDCNNHIAAHDLPQNEVVRLLHKSGECLCGAYAKKGELQELKIWFPDVAARICALEVKVRAAGFDWGWEDGKTTRRTSSERAGPLCHSCEKQETLFAEDKESQ